MAKWWERLPPANVARVRFPDQASHVGWLSLLLVLVLAPRVLNDSTGTIPPTTRFTFHGHKKGKKTWWPVIFSFIRHAILGVWQARRISGFCPRSLQSIHGSYCQINKSNFFVLFFVFCFFFHNITPLAERNLACLVCEGRTAGTGSPHIRFRIWMKDQITFIARVLWRPLWVFNTRAQ